MLHIQNLSASIEGKKILSSISAEFEPGTTTALLGPNGSGKSTFGNTLMGAPFIETDSHSTVKAFSKNLLDLPVNERATLGLFMTFQNPLPLGGVSVMEMLRAALITGPHKRYSPQELHTLVHQYAEELELSKEFLKRSLYEGFSGGERKKMEALQAAIFQPKIIIFDELDTGVDVDALKVITRFLKKNLPKDSIQIFITHSHKLLKLYQPDQVLVLKKGKLVQSGGVELADKIEKSGFSQM